MNTAVLTTYIAPVVALFIGIAGGAVKNYSEISPSQYLIIANTVKSANPNYRALVSRDFADNKISNQEFSGLLENYWKVSSSLLVATDEHVTLEQAKASLNAALQQH